VKDLGARKLPRVALLIESSRTYGRGLVQGIAQYGHVHGPWSFFIIERDLHGGVPELVKTLQVDGVIARIEDEAMAAQLQSLGCPVVDVLGQASFETIPSFDTDASAVAALAASFFLQAGFQHFAYVGYPGIPFSDRRKAAFARQVVQHNRRLRLAPPLPEFRGPKHIQAVERQGIAGEKALARWLRKQPRPLAVLACNDVCAQQVLNACREYGLRVPEEIAVMGVDNDDVLCNVCDPPLSSVEPDTQRLGYEAAAMLHRMMSGENPGHTMTLVPPTRLVERASTDTVAIDDPVAVAALRYIRDHLAEGIAVKDVEAHVQRSRSDLEKRFRRWLRTSVRAEILRRRLDRVCGLLRDTELGLEQITQKAGFATAAHLCRLFQKKYAQTPMGYRRAQGKSRQSKTQVANCRAGFPRQS